MPESYAAKFAEARSIISRVVRDWPYQPPEIIEPEREAIARWLEDNPFDLEASMTALREDSDA